MACLLVACCLLLAACIFPSPFRPFAHSPFRPFVACCPHFLFVPFFTFVFFLFAPSDSFFSAIFWLLFFIYFFELGGAFWGRGW
jgi:hypothetical protein